MDQSISGIVISGERDFRAEFTELEVLGGRASGKGVQECERGLRSCIEGGKARGKASGGFNVIVRAKRYGRWWVLKGLREEFRESETHRQLLRKEFEILGGMQHPGVVMAVGMEEVEGLGEVIVMEWVDGVTLREWLRGEAGEGDGREGGEGKGADGEGVGNGRDGRGVGRGSGSGVGRSVAERLRVAFQIMDALKYVHSRQTAHRDLKPSNIMITRNGGHVKLIDFGLADTDDYAVYKQPAGTVGYMSPEQAEARVCDIRNDIYSLGCVLEDMNLGRRYAGIVRRCKAESMIPEREGRRSSCGRAGDADKRNLTRFNNIGEVRRAFRRVDSARRGLWLAMDLAVALLVGYFLSDFSTRKFRTDVETLRAEQEERMLELDSLKAEQEEWKVEVDSLRAEQDARRIETEQLQAERKAAARHQAEIEAVIAEGKRQMDEVMNAIDLSTINTWEKASMAQYDAAQKLTTIWDSYPRSLGDSFTATERESIKSTLASHWSDIMKPLNEKVLTLAGR